MPQRAGQVGAVNIVVHAARIAACKRIVVEAHRIVHRHRRPVVFNLDGNGPVAIGKRGGKNQIDDITAAGGTRNRVVERLQQVEGEFPGDGIEDKGEDDRPAFPLGALDFRRANQRDDNGIAAGFEPLRHRDAGYTDGARLRALHRTAALTQPAAAFADRNRGYRRNLGVFLQQEALLLYRLLEQLGKLFVGRRRRKRGGTEEHEFEIGLDCDAALTQRQRCELGHGDAAEQAVDLFRGQCGDERQRKLVEGNDRLVGAVDHHGGGQILERPGANRAVRLGQVDAGDGAGPDIDRATDLGAADADGAGRGTHLHMVRPGRSHLAGNENKGTLDHRHQRRAGIGRRVVDQLVQDHAGVAAERKGRLVDENDADRAIGGCLYGVALVNRGANSERHLIAVGPGRGSLPAEAGDLADIGEAGPCGHGDARRGSALVRSRDSLGKLNLTAAGRRSAIGAGLSAAVIRGRHIPECRGASSPSRHLPLLLPCRTFLIRFVVDRLSPCFPNAAKRCDVWLREPLCRRSAYLNH